MCVTDGDGGFLIGGAVPSAGEIVCGVTAFRVRFRAGAALGGSF